VNNLSTGETCELDYFVRGWTKKNAFKVSGDVKSRDGKVKFKVTGHWND
jgi:hypothetical protein